MYNSCSLFVMLAGLCTRRTERNGELLSSVRSCCRQRSYVLGNGRDDFALAFRIIACLYIWILSIRVWIIGKMMFSNLKHNELITACNVPTQGRYAGAMGVKGTNALSTVEISVIIWNIHSEILYSLQWKAFWHAVSVAPDGCRSRVNGIANKV